MENNQQKNIAMFIDCDNVSAKYIDSIFKDLYDEMIELKKYFEIYGIDEYIKLVNTKFDTSKFCWWENIKTKKELGI